MAEDANRTEKATPKHRSEARRRGQVARSTEISSTVALAMGLAGLIWFGSMLGYGLLDFSREMFTAVRYGAVSVPGTELYFMASIKAIMAATVFWMLLLGGGALIAGYGQVGFDGQEMKVRWENLNPVAGMQRLFSFASVVRAVVSILKMLVIGFVCKGTVDQLLQSEILRRQASAFELIHYLIEAILALGWKVVMVLVLIAAGDYAYQRWQHEKNLKMSKEEVKEEGKQAEGNPEIKGKIRSIMTKRHRQRMMEAVRTASVVVTNPTHVAVALRYDRSKDRAPVVVAKGLRLIAERIKEVAREHNVPIIENKSLARGLYRHGKIDKEIPVNFYQAVAVILAQVYRLATQKTLTVPIEATPTMTHGAPHAGQEVHLR
jgi:flagellar biosynthesis protein FlhB